MALRLFPNIYNHLRCGSRLPCHCTPAKYRIFCFPFVKLPQFFKQPILQGRRSNAKHRSLIIRGSSVFCFQLTGFSKFRGSQPAWLLFGGKHQNLLNAAVDITTGALRKESFIGLSACGFGIAGVLRPLLCGNRMKNSLVIRCQESRKFQQWSNLLCIITVWPVPFFS